MGLHDPRHDQGRRPKPPPNRRGPAVALAVILFLGAALFWLGGAIVRHNALQNCIDSGRRDCVPIPSNP